MSHETTTPAVENLKAENTRLRTELSELRATISVDATTLLLADAIQRDTPQLEFFQSEVAGRVSVIMPAYNAGRFVERAIRSVWGQTLPTEQVELLVIDDGSHDATAMICRNLIKESPVRMRLLQHPDGVNLGVSASRQLGCAEASGEFIALLDADDLFLPERLERGIDTLRASPGTAAMCSLGHNVDLDGKAIRGYNGTLIAGDWASIDGGLAPPFTFDQLWDAYPIANSSLTVRRSAMQVVGGYPALMAHQAEDWLLVLKLSLLSPIPCIEEPLMHYTHHAQAYTTLYNEQGLHEGARIEIFYHLVWWMLHKEEYAPAGHRFFRREYPRLISDHQRLLPLLRNYVQLGGHAADGLKGVEEYVRRLYEESIALRRVADAKLTENRCLRKLLGREHSDDDDLLQQLQQECESLHRVLRHIQEENRQLRAALDDTDHAELPEN